MPRLQGIDQHRGEAEGEAPPAPLVLINAYGNGGINPGLISQALDVIGRKRVLGLVTAYNADTGEPPAPDTNILFRAAKEHRHRIFVLDWVEYSLSHHTVEPTPGALVPSRPLPPDYTGAQAFADFLAEALPLARQGGFRPCRRFGRGSCGGR